MRRTAIACAALMLTLVAPSHDGLASGTKPNGRLGLILQDNVRMYSGPSATTRVLAVLVQQTQVDVLAKRGSWSHVTLWASIRGWVPSKSITFRHPWSTVSTYKAPRVHYHVHAYAPRALNVRAIITSPVALHQAPDGSPIRWLPTGVHAVVKAWRQDSLGKIWYRIGGLWAPGDNIRFQYSGIASNSSYPGRAWKRISGKGMWLTLGTIADTPPDVLVRAARRNGLTHLYLEAAISPLGFHGRDSVGHLIEAAHRSHMAVIAWVYPYLYDVASDVDLTRQVAAFRTASGDGFDGIAADLEANVHLWNVRGFSQLVRNYLGPGYLLVGVTYPPQDFPTYPFAEVARTYNVLAPMDYWHQTRTKFGLNYGRMRYGYAYGYRYASDSIRAIHAVVAGVHVAPIGQTFDNFGRLEMGPHAPSASEITGFLAGSKDSGAVSVTFFQWMTATNAEWQAIQSFRV